MDLRTCLTAIISDPEEQLVDITGCVLCLAFHPRDENLFLLGTEEGVVYKCSKLCTTRPLETYRVHTAGVYSLQWNLHHPVVFISCSADWTVRLWDHRVTSPMYTFDLCCPVNDVAWSPYSSTVFSAVTAEGKVYVYDLTSSKYQPVCVQSLVSKRSVKLTRLAFNTAHPMILVGNDRGVTFSLKMSPNLRKVPKEAKGADAAKVLEIEVAKMDKLLALVRDQQDE
jgi:dynein intermediate chain 1